MQQTIDNLLNFFHQLVYGFATSSWIYEANLDIFGYKFTPLTFFTVSGLTLFVSLSITTWCLSGLFGAVAK